MPSTYSPNLRIELIGYGEQNNTWGTTTNTNLGTLIEQAIAGKAAVDVTAGNVTLTAVDGATDQSRQMILAITGTPGVARTVTAPSVSKVYVVANGSNATITIKMATGTGVAVSSGKAKFVYCNGTDFYEATTEQASAAITNLTVSGTITGTGFSTYLASPPAIGGTSAAAGTFTALTSTGNTILGDAAADTVTINGTIQPGVVISGSFSSDALRITQTGTGNALVVEDSANPDSTPFVIDTVGNVVLGSSAQRFSANLLEINNAGNSDSGLGVIQWFTTNASGPAINIMKSQSGTPGTNGIVSNGAFSTIFFRFDDGANFLQAATITAAVDGTPGTNDMPGRLVFSTAADGASSPTERMRINNAGNVGIGSGVTSTDSVVTVNKSMTGATTTFGIRNLSTVQSDSTSAAVSFQSAITTAATVFTLSGLRHFNATQPTFGAGSTVTTQIGFLADASLTGATNNFGFYSGIASGSGRYNFYAAGTADNYFAGRVGIGNVPTTFVSVDIQGTYPAGSFTRGFRAAATIPSSVIGNARLFSTEAYTSAATFTLTSLSHYMALQQTIGAGSIVANQYGFSAESNLVGATNDYGFYSNIPAVGSGTGSTSSVSSVSSTGATVTINTIAAHGLSTNQTVTISLTANATALVSGVPCTILTVGTTDFTLIGASSNAVGVSFTATGVGTGSGTVTLNQQNSGKTISVVNSTQFTYSSSVSATFASISATGTITPNIRYNFYSAGTADNYFEGNVKTNGTLAGGYLAHAAGTTAMALGSNTVVKVTPNATASFTTTVAPAGATASIIIVTSGTTSYTITFGTGFLTTGTLATGTVTAKTFVVNFVSDGTTMIETSRTVAM